MIRALVLLGTLALGACATTVSEEPAARSVTLAAGPAKLGDEGWSNYDDRPQVMLGFTHRKPDAAVGAEASFQAGRSEAKEDPDERSADFFDLRVGVNRDFEPFDRLRIVGGAGVRLSVVNVNLVGTYSPTSESGGSLGVYAHAGVFCRVTGRFSIGVDAQWADGSDYSIADTSRDARVSMLLVALRWEF